MKLFRSSTLPAVGDAIAKAVNYEVTIADIARRSERRAWWVAATAVAVSVVLAGGYVALLPLKEQVPYLVMADAYTGTASVARLRDDFSHNGITVSEAINRSNVAHFVIARESYDLELQQLRDWLTVYTMSSPTVASGYTTLHARNNPQAPYHLYPGKAIRVRLLSITLHGGDGRQTAPTGATVRFQRFLYDKSSGVSRPLDSKIATLAFTYKSNLKMSEEQRIANPLGFQVTSYRVDNDYAAAPPLGEFAGEAMEGAGDGAAPAAGLSSAPGAAHVLPAESDGQARSATTDGVPR